MKTLRQYRRLLTDWVHSSADIGPILLAVTIGGGAGVAAIVFRRLIALVHWLFQGELGGAAAGVLGSAYAIPIIALGGLLVGLITKYLAPETKGHGVPEVMLAVSEDGGRIRPRVTLFKTLAAALTIGSGGSAGREGPIVQIGSAFGSTLAQWFRLPDRRVILSVACGAAGGVAATFNAPIAGVMFALEVILGRFTAMSFGLVVLSSATATVVARSLSEEGDSPAFNVIHEYAMRSIWDLLLFVALGVLCALLAEFYTKFLYFVEDLSDKVKTADFLKPALGGALVGVIAVWRPEIMGTGYETIEGALNNQMLAGTLLILCLAKILCTSLSIGTGGSGGIFAPALFIGAMFGGGFGTLVHNALPELTSSPGAYALVGMAAVFAGAARAPITAILILFEMTDDYRLIVPLMTATVVTTFVSQRLSHESIYTIKLRRRGIDIGRTHEVNLMDAITVGEAMDAHFDYVQPGWPLSSAIEKMTREHESGYPVIDDRGHLKGIITMRDIEDAMVHHDLETTTVDHICTKNVVVARPEQTLSRALAQFGARNVDRLPVIDPERPRHIIGLLNRSDVVTAYAEAHRRSVNMLPQADAVMALGQGHEMVVKRRQVTAGSRLQNKLVKDAGFPEHSVLGAIHRAHETIVPTGATQILPGDELLVLTVRQHEKTVLKWLRQNT